MATDPDLSFAVSVECAYGQKRVLGHYLTNKSVDDIFDSYVLVSKMYDFRLTDIARLKDTNINLNVMDYRAVVSPDMLERLHEIFANSTRSMGILSAEPDGCCYLCPPKNLELILEYASLMDTDLKWKLSNIEVDNGTDQT